MKLFFRFEGVVLLDPPFTAVYRGLWGVNGLLSMWAVTAHSFVLSWHSLAAGLACVCLTAGLQAAFEPPLRAVRRCLGPASESKAPIFFSPG